MNNEDLIARVKEDNVKFISLQFTDVTGVVKSVDFPAPFFPIIPTCSPSRISRLMFRRATILSVLPRLSFFPRAFLKLLCASECLSNSTLTFSKRKIVLVFILQVVIKF